MITREQVAELRVGDVVEYAGHRDLRGAKLIGPLTERGGLYIADYVVRDGLGKPPAGGPWGDPVLTVVSRAPRPLYVNHDRTEPVPGDVVRGDASADATTFVRSPGSGPKGNGWWVGCSGQWVSDRGIPARLRLLVDGETGQVVP